MGGKNSKGLKKQSSLRDHVPVEREATLDSNWNSLVADQHVDSSAAESMEVFTEVKEMARKMGLANIRVRGLKVENKQGEAYFAKIEVLIDEEKGISEFLKLLNENKDRIHFTYVRIMGDSHQ